MGLTYFYAEIFGIVFTTIGVAFLLNLRQMLAIAHEVIDDRGVLFVIGILTLILGSFLVLTENIWNAGFLAGLVSLIGWLLLIRAILLLWLPHGTIRKIFNAVKFEQSYYAFGIIILLVGLYLAYTGFNL